MITFILCDQLSTNFRRKMIVIDSGKRPIGRGLLDKAINNLPFEMHLPGYQYCGPGTKLKKRLARGDPGINPLDQACKEHDIAYSNKQTDRKTADMRLADRAWQRVISNDASKGERAAAYAVTNAMKLKVKTGMGMKFNKIVAAAKKSMKPSKCSRKVIQSALKGARLAVKKFGNRKKLIYPRVLPVSSKIGGIIPFLIPLFAGLSATGALAGGAAGIAKAINDSKSAQRELEESKRHNNTMEAIALGKGLYLKPFKTGMGLYLKPSGKGLKKKSSI